MFMSSRRELGEISAASRGRILYRLMQHGLEWCMVDEILKPLGKDGPFSEDLQDLVNKGVVECNVPVLQMGMRSMIRLKKAVVT